MPPGSAQELSAGQSAHEAATAGSPALGHGRLGIDIPPSTHALYESSKRTLDVTIALVLLVIAAPIVLAASVAIVLTTRQNPLLVQRRVGLAGCSFPMLKLRTMRPGSGDEPNLPVASGDVFVSKVPRDPRVTAVGRILRRTSIDELPQVVNVLLGQMSLVGPRPALPEEVVRYPRAWHRRLAVKPGLTGLWQVSGRSDIAPRRRVAMDVVYIRRRSLGFDAAILIRTVAAAISMRGAW